MWLFKSSPTSTRAEPSPPLLEVPVTRMAPPPSPESSPAEAHETPVVTVVGWPHERLSIPVPLRAPIVMMTSFACGFMLGATQGSQKAAYRYRAENAHRLPTTQNGWFLYQKSKNYNAMLGGVKEGVKFGSICTIWGTLFMVTEEMVDLSRARLLARGDEDVAVGQRDVGSTVVAGLSLAGFYSWTKRMDHFGAARTARTALKFAVPYGLLQDLFATLRGNPPAYVAWVERKTFWRDPP